LFCRLVVQAVAVLVALMVAVVPTQIAAVAVAILEFLLLQKHREIPYCLRAVEAVLAAVVALAAVARGAVQMGKLDLVARRAAVEHKLRAARRVVVKAGQQVLRCRAEMLFLVAVAVILEVAQGATMVHTRHLAVEVQGA
jgi:hypothetical protein